jgi:16S rRNA (guanine527-N7)-methyltransferase
MVEAVARFNLTAITDGTGIVVQHFADSLSALRWCVRVPGRAQARPIRLIDVGSGAGLPGIPLKIAQPALHVTLLDGTGKKVAFCEEVIRDLQLGGICALKGRAEEIARQPQHREQYDVAIARAVAPLPTLMEYLLPFVRQGGVSVAMKGGEAELEVARARRAIAALGGDPERVEVDTFTLPELQHRRALVVVHKARPTPGRYPRQAGAPRAKPIA